LLFSWKIAVIYRGLTVSISPDGDLTSRSPLSAAKIVATSSVEPQLAKQTSLDALRSDTCEQSGLDARAKAAAGSLPPCGRENSPYRHPANKLTISTPELAGVFVAQLA
jgi:hypothetical protein